MLMTAAATMALTTKAKIIGRMLFITRLSANHRLCACDGERAGAGTLSGYRHSLYR
jgi:hypothetical protein